MTNAVSQDRPTLQDYVADERRRQRTELETSFFEKLATKLDSLPLVPADRQALESLVHNFASELSANLKYDSDLKKLNERREVAKAASTTQLQLVASELARIGVILGRLRLNIT